MGGKYRIRKLAMREITRLLDMALDPKTPIEYADRYVEIAREISMKTRVRIPRRYKMFICKGCRRILRPGETAMFRLFNKPKKHIYIKCLRCGKIYRRGYS